MEQVRLNEKMNGKAGTKGVERVTRQIDSHAKHDKSESESEEIREEKKREKNEREEKRRGERIGIVMRKSANEKLIKKVKRTSPGVRMRMFVRQKREVKVVVVVSRCGQVM